MSTIKPKNHVCTCGKDYQFLSGLARHQVSCSSAKETKKDDMIKNIALEVARLVKTEENTLIPEAAAAPVLQTKAIEELKTEDGTLYLMNWSAADCIKSLPKECLQCVICDPPFGLGEDTFDKHYAREKDGLVTKGYVTAPEGAAAYEAWCKTWIHELPRVLKPDGTVYIICAWNHVCDVELAIRSAPAPGLSVLNHCIWKYNFGVYTQKKFVSSHYHILRCGRGDLRSKVPAFYNRAFFNETERVAGEGNLQYRDMEDVFVIPKEFAQGEKKNVNKLPDALIHKLMNYSSKPGDLVADFFLGNFTTAYVARRGGRRFVGCELNPKTYALHAKAVSNIVFPTDVPHEKESTKPENAGQPLSEEERKKIVARFDALRTPGADKKSMTKKDAMLVLEKEFGRGHFSLVNLLKAAKR